MGRRDIASPKYLLRDLVLKHGGTMTIAAVLNSRQFRGYDTDFIRRLVFTLRSGHKGQDGHKGRDFGFGQEAWEILDKTIYGLESCLTQGMRRRIQMRRHAKERGVSEQTDLDNLIFRGRIERNGVVHKEAIVRGLEASSQALKRAVSSSSSVRGTLEEHEKDFVE